MCIRTREKKHNKHHKSNLTSILHVLVYTQYTKITANTTLNGPIRWEDESLIRSGHATRHPYPSVRNDCLNHRDYKKIQEIYLPLLLLISRRRGTTLILLALKGIFQPFELGGVTRLIRSAVIFRQFKKKIFNDTNSREELKTN